jgi:predicted DCC family thiol-disulfide oxidoreductase YuxK
MGFLQGAREAARERPVVVYDGDCVFCMRQVERLRRHAGSTVDLAPYQDAAPRFPSVPAEAFRRSVVLVDTDGRVYDGAEAVFRALAAGPRGGAGLWCYRSLPGFAALSEGVYRWVARNRGKLPRW